MMKSNVVAAFAVALIGCGGAVEELVPPGVPAGSEVRSEEVTYAAGDVTLRGYLAYDTAQEGPRPGVLVVHEWWGHNDYARMRARMLAAMGYTALAVDMYGDGKQAEHPEDAQKFSMEIASRLDVAVARFEAARALLENHPTTDGERTAAIGYCFGGSVVLHMMRVGLGLAGVASFHGDFSPLTPAVPAAAETSVLVLHGADDPFVSRDRIEPFKQEMADAGVALRFVEYPGAVHSFTNPGATALGEQFELPLAYDVTADRASWAELESFLAEVFAAG